MTQISLPTSVTATLDLPFPNWSATSERKRYDTDQARVLLDANGLNTLDSLFALANRCLHQHKQRAVSRVLLHAPHGELIEAYIKFNWGRRRLIPRLTDLKTGMLFRSHPAREWAGIGLLGALGLLVPERIALFQRGLLWFQEAILIKRVPPRFSLDEMLRSDLWQQLPSDDQHGLLASVVDVMQRIHRAGLGWRGTCTRHFFPERAADGSWQLWLIDCEGVHGGVNNRAIQRDYRKLRRAFEISGADTATLELYQQLADAAQRTPARFILPPTSSLMWANWNPSVKLPK